MDKTVSVIGLGKLGSPIALSIASKGFNVVGVDNDLGVVDRINRGIPPVSEPGLEELLIANRTRVSATHSIDQAVLESRIIFIVVPTPSDSSGRFSLQHVAQVASQIGKALGKSDHYQVVVISSTVLPGSTQFGILPLLESQSGKRCGKDFGLCYNPEFVALGSVIRDFLNPDFALIGESDDKAGSEVESFLSAVYDNRPPVARMGFVNAELTKIALNTYVTTKITFANMLREVCERLPGGDVDVVTRALGLDSRIGGRYLKGGLGYGGPCFPRDNLALGYLARELGTNADLAKETNALNRMQVRNLHAIVQSRTSHDSRVAVLGLSYKPDSDVIEESQGLMLARGLAGHGYRVSVFDPLAMDNARAELGDKVTYAPSMESCIYEADTIVIVNPDPAFRLLDISQIHLY